MAITETVRTDLFLLRDGKGFKVVAGIAGDPRFIGDALNSAENSVFEVRVFLSRVSISGVPKEVEPTMAVERRLTFTIARALTGEDLWEPTLCELCSERCFARSDYGSSRCVFVRATRTVDLSRFREKTQT